jgi:hypothetical protein
MQASEFFARLWNDYTTVTPQAQRVFSHVESAFGTISNDHVAFRTFDRDRVRLEILERSFLNFGYKRGARYEFPDKHLEAYGYIPPEAGLPLVFLSQLRCDELPDGAGALIEECLYSVERMPDDPSELLQLGRPWAPPSWEDYLALSDVSPYAAWLSVWGFRANHFTVAVHSLPAAPTLEELVQSLQEVGYAMNEEGGLIKGSPGVLLEQAATLAEERPVVFSDGDEHHVPSCYYEFARRYPQADGQLYQGFVAASANNIFESTTAKKGDEGPAVAVPK